MISIIVIGYRWHNNGIRQENIFGGANAMKGIMKLILLCVLGKHQLLSCSERMEVNGEHV